MTSSTYRDNIIATRNRKSYRLLVLSWRVLCLAVAVGALTQVLWANRLISHTVMIILMVPVILVFLGCWLVGLATLAIQAAHFSVNPLARGVIRRQVAFSRMFVVDVFTLPWRLSNNSERE